MQFFTPIAGAKETSFLSLSLSLNQEALTAYINALIPNSLFESNGSDGNKMTVTASKSGDITFKFHENEIRYKVPIHVDVKKNIAVGDVEANGLAHLSFSTSVKLGDNFSVTTQTQLLNHKWERPPKVKAGFMTIPVEAAVDLFIKKKKDFIGEKIDQELQKALDVKLLSEKIFEQLKEPLLLDKERFIYALPNLKSIGMTPILYINEELKTNLQVEFDPFLAMLNNANIQGETPDFQTPKLRKQKEGIGAVTKSSSINWSFYLSFDQLENLIKQQIVGEQLEAGGNQVTIEDLQISKKGASLVLKAQMSGSYDGKFILTGIPKVDYSNGNLKLENIDFDLQTDSFLMKTVGWVFKKSLKGTIDKNVNPFLASSGQKLAELIEGQLNNLPLPMGFQLNSKIKVASFENLKLEEEALKVELRTDGDLEVVISDFSYIQTLQKA